MNKRHASYIHLDKQNWKNAVIVEKSKADARLRLKSAGAVYFNIKRKNESTA